MQTKTHTHTHTRSHTHTRARAHAHTRTHTHTYTYTHSHMQTHADAYRYPYKHMHRNTYKHIYIYIRAHAKKETLLIDGKTLHRYRERCTPLNIRAGRPCRNASKLNVYEFHLKRSAPTPQKQPVSNNVLPRESGSRNPRDPKPTSMQFARTPKF